MGEIANSAASGPARSAYALRPSINNRRAGIAASLFLVSAINRGL